VRVARYIAALVAVLAAIHTAQAAGEPRVRAEIVGAQPVLVGQAVRLDVTVLVPNFFLSSPQFPTFETPGAIVTLLDQSGINSSETLDGMTYAGITRSYTITPQQAGVFTLPPVQISFRYAAEPGQPGVEGAVTLPPQTLTARLPQGAAATSAPPLVVKVVIEQSVDGDPKAMKAGDALTRTIDIFAANTHAMMIPPSKFEAPPGVNVYVRDPTVADVTTDRGVFTGGQRVDRATYVFEKPGNYVLPAIAIDWFDAASGKQDVSTAPQIAVSVAPIAAAPPDGLAPPAPLPSAPDQSPRVKIWWARALAWLLGLSVGAVALIWLFKPFGLRIWDRVLLSRQTRRTSEPASFARLKQACRSNAASQAYHELGVWVRRQGFATLRAAGERAPMLAAQIAVLEVHLYGPSPAAPWSGAALFDSAIAARAHWHTAQRSRSPTMLPALNPWR
jgi:hypothetical protein